MKKITGYFFIFIFIFGLLISFPVNNYVTATTTMEYIDWEGGTVGQPFSNSFLITEASGGASSNFAVNSVNARTGSRDFYSNNYKDGWWNLSYSGYLIGFSMYWDWYSAQHKILTFYNSSLGISKPIVIMQYFYAGLHAYDIGYYDHTGAFIYIKNMPSPVGYILTSWDCIDMYGTISYNVDGTMVTGEARNLTAIINGYSIDSIFVDIADDYVYYDDLAFTISSNYSGGGIPNESYCGYDVSTYDTQIGNIYNIANFIDVHNRTISSNFGSSIDTTIRGVALTVSIDMFNEDSNANNYTLSVNDVTIGGADCFTPYTNFMGLYYILYWDLSTRLYNESPTFIFNHNKVGTGGRYWAVGNSFVGEDIDNDGDSIFYYNTASTTYSWKWIQFGVIFVPFYLPNTVYVSNYPSDLGMSFWCDSLTTPIIPVNYTDTIGLSNWNYENDTGFVYLIPDVASKGIVVSYTLASQIDSYSIWINKTDYTGWGYPYVLGDFPVNSIPYPDGVYSCIPDGEGRYDFMLLKKVGTNHTLVAVVTAWVTGNWSNESYYIYTNPPITYQFDSYDVVYKFSNPNGYNGYVAMFDDILQFQQNGFYGKVSGWDIGNNVSDSQTYSSYSATSEYWGLYGNKTNGYVLVFPLHTHTIKLYSVVENKIWVLPTSLTIKSGNPENLLFTIYYQHRFVGTGISVYIDNVFFAPVGNSASGTVTYKPYNAGIHTASLILNQNGTPITVATTTFTVSINQTGGGGGGLIIEAPYSYILGAIITVMFIIAPVYFVGKLNINSDIVKYVPVFTGMIGFILCCLVGFFPWYAIFGLVLILVLVIVIMWQNNKA